MTRPVATFREAIASARSQPVASVVTVLVVAGMMIAVMLTTGRTVGAEQNVLQSLDMAGTRAIVVRAGDDAGITSDVMTRIARIEGIEWAIGLSSAVDGTNARNIDGMRVPVRYAYGSDLERLGIPAALPFPGDLVYASHTALQQLGLVDTAGGVTLTTGASYGVGGEIATPDFLQQFEPIALIPQPTAISNAPINLLVVIADRPDLVSPVSDTVLSVLAASDPSKISVETSESLAQLRSLIQGQLGSFSRGMVLVILGVSGVLVAVILYGLVMMRRKDFGRRRALGAPRSLIIVLLLTQTAVLATVGVALGFIVSMLVLIAYSDPFPGPVFVSALCVLAITTAAVAAVIPALIASRREPINELRVP